MFDFALKHTTDEIDRRLRNPFWGWLIIGWITWNWRVWYLTFFVSESLVGNKISEIQRMYEYFWWHALPGIILNWVIIPVFIAYCAIFLFPKLTDEFLKKQKKNKENEDEILRADLKAEEENAKASTKLLKAQKEEFDALKEKLKAENDAEIERKANELAQEKIAELNMMSDELSEKNIWNKEYELLKSKNILFLDKLTDLIYNHGWSPYDFNEAKYIKIFEVNELVDRRYNENDSITYALTEKWKFFLKKETLWER